MRTLGELPDAHVKALDDLSTKEKRSRAALIRDAIDDYLSERRLKQADEAFGLWGNRKIDGLTYQKRVRDEW